MFSRDFLGPHFGSSCNVCDGLRLNNDLTKIGNKGTTGSGNACCRCQRGASLACVCQTFLSMVSFYMAHLIKGCSLHGFTSEEYVYSGKNLLADGYTWDSKDKAF
ncbi:hypothetical protein MTO96_044360 [Rhipicephalus appendiculatus]